MKAAWAKSRRYGVRSARALAGGQDTSRHRGFGGFPQNRHPSFRVYGSRKNRVYLFRFCPYGRSSVYRASGAKWSFGPSPLYICKGSSLGRPALGHLLLLLHRFALQDQQELHCHEVQGLKVISSLDPCLLSSGLDVRVVAVILGCKEPSHVNKIQGVLATLSCPSCDSCLHLLSFPFLRWNLFVLKYLRVPRFSRAVCAATTLL